MTGSGTDGPEARGPDFVEALANGLAVIQAFDARHPEMTLSDVARRVGLSPATARRSLKTLEALGYVGQRARRFHLKPRVLTLGSGFYFAARIDELLLPELRAIVDRHGDAASVATLDGHDVVYIAHHSTQRARRATAVVGARYPAHATSLGRILLAGLADDALDAWFDTLVPLALTSRTVTDKAALRAVVLQARADGYATSVDQLDYGITALAVPVRAPDGRTVAALNSSGYTGILTPEAMVADRLSDLRAAAAQIAQSAARVPALAAVLDMG